MGQPWCLFGLGVIPILCSVIIMMLELFSLFLFVFKSAFIYVGVALDTTSLLTGEDLLVSVCL